MKCETDRKGTVFYSAELKGPFDGCRLELAYYPSGGELVLEVDDDRNQDVVELMKFQTENRQTELGDEYIYLTTVEQRESAVDAVSNSGDLKNLAAWWITENVCPTVSIEGKVVFEKGAGTMSLVMEELVKSSRMDDFFEGRRVPLSDGSSILTDFVMEESENGKYGWAKVEIVQGDGGDQEYYAGFIQGFVFREVRGGFVLVVDEWQNDDRKYDWTKDLLAFQLRLLANILPDKVTVVNKDTMLTMPEDEIDWRTSFWLGF